MRDAIPLIGKHVVLGDTLYVIEDFYHVPGSVETYVKLRKHRESIWLNYPLSDLKPHIEDQIKL